MERHASAPLAAVVGATRWPPSRAALIALVMATWSEFAPRSLRAALAGLIRWRSRWAPAQPGTPPVSWHPAAGLAWAAEPRPAAANSFAFVAASCAPDGPWRECALAAAAAGPIDGEALLRLARWHRVEPLVHAAVVATDVTLAPDVATQLAQRARQGRLTAIANIAEEGRLADAARTAGLDLLFVKGATLAQLAHPDPTAKRAWDIDVLIAPQDLAAARAFLTAQGYALKLPNNVAPGPQLDRWLAGNRESLWRNATRRTAVELHTGLCESPALLRGVGMGSPRQQVMLAGTSVPTLATPELFAFLAVHGTSHAWARLKWLADVAALVTASGLDIAALHDGAIARGAGHCPGVALILCADLLGLALPSKLEARLRGDPNVTRLCDRSRRAITAQGGRNGKLGAESVREIAGAMRLQYRLAPGLRHRAETFWSQWTRPYARSQLGIPGWLLPVAMLGWLPLRLMLRPWRR